VPQLRALISSGVQHKPTSSPSISRSSSWNSRLYLSWKNGRSSTTSLISAGNTRVRIITRLWRILCLSFTPASPTPKWIRNIRPVSLQVMEHDRDLGLISKTEVLSVLQKIINLTCRQSDGDITKLSRWLRCLFKLSLEHDESISLKCIEQATHIAAKKQGVSAPFINPGISLRSSRTVMLLPSPLL
jgi:hypothetical protein